MYRELEAFYGQLAAAEYGVDPDRAVAAAAILLAGLSGLIDRWSDAGDDRQLLEETFVSVTLGAMERLAPRASSASARAG